MKSAPLLAFRFTMLHLFPMTLQFSAAFDDEDNDEATLGNFWAIVLKIELFTYASVLICGMCTPGLKDKLWNPQTKHLWLWTFKLAVCPVETIVTSLITHHSTTLRPLDHITTTSISNSIVLGILVSFLIVIGCGVQWSFVWCGLASKSHSFVVCSITFSLNVLGEAIFIGVAAVSIHDFYDYKVGESVAAE